MISMDRIVRGSPRSRTDIVLPEENLPIGKTLALGLQHVLAMFGATVLAPLLMGFDPSLAVFFSGLGTMLFLLITRGSIPSYLGSSFAFIGPVLAAGSKDGNLSGALFGILAAAVVYAIIGAVVVLSGASWVEFLMPPIVTGAVVMVIGLNLANVAGGMFMANWPLALITLLAAVLIAVYTRGFVSMLPILLGVAFGYLVSLLNTLMGNPFPALGLIDTTAIDKAAWLGIPNFVTPSVDWNAALLIAPVAIVLVAENTGHVKAISGNMGRNLTPKLGHAFLGDAAGTALSALGGGTGQTTYAENIGVMAMTRVYSIAVFVVASATAILLGFIPKFAALIQSIPVAVMGGISLLLFGLIAATGGRIWVDGAVDFAKQRNLIVGGVTIVVGAISIAPPATPFAFNIGGFELSGIALATLVAIVLNQLLAFRERRDEATEAGTQRDQTPAPGVADAQPEPSR
jgi:putative pyrimidine permease RutG